MKTLIKARIEEGISVLDQVNPDWRSVIDLDSLHLADPATCVLGQLYGAYGVGLDEIGKAIDVDLEFGACVDREAWAVEHGFEMSRAYGYAELQEAWEEVLTAPPETP